MADEYNRAVGGATNCNWWEPSPTTRTTSSSVIDSAATDPHSLQMIGLSSHQRIHPHWNSTRDDAGDDDDQIISGGFRSLVQESMPFLPAGDPSPEFNSIRGSPAAAAFSHSSSSVDSSSHGGGLPSPTFLTQLDSASGFFQGLIASSPASDHQSGFGYNQPAGGYSDNLMGWTQFLKPNSMAEAKPIQPQLMNVNTHGSFWSAAAAAIADPRPAAFFPVAPPLLQPPQMAVPSFNEKRKNNMMEVKNTSGAGRKSTTSGSNRTSTTATASTTSTGSGTTAKRSRNEASSATLPPFKVRKEKMGDRITALQQLVSPFGKTDTASVLSEAIEYIKFLHEQVNVLSTPYLKSGASLQQQQSHGKFKDQDQGARQDIRSRGLCLVPVSSTFPVAHETTVDFWTPTFGPPGAFR